MRRKPTAAVPRLVEYSEKITSKLSELALNEIAGVPGCLDFMGEQFE